LNKGREEFFKVRQCAQSIPYIENPYRVILGKIKKLKNYANMKIKAKIQSDVEKRVSEMRKRFHDPFKEKIGFLKRIW
jgi:hypothetical protein